MFCARYDEQAAERELRALGEEISQMEAKKQEVCARNLFFCLFESFIGIEHLT